MLTIHGFITSHQSSTLPHVLQHIRSLKMTNPYQSALASQARPNFQESSEPCPVWIMTFDADTKSWGIHGPRGVKSHPALMNCASSSLSFWRGIMRKSKILESRIFFGNQNNPDSFDIFLISGLQILQRAHPKQLHF